jgi:hypothetical protein
MLAHKGQQGWLLNLTDTVNHTVQQLSLPTTLPPVHRAIFGNICWPLKSCMIFVRIEKLWEKIDDVHAKTLQARLRLAFLWCLRRSARGTPQPTDPTVALHAMVQSAFMLATLPT